MEKSLYINDDIEYDENETIYPERQEVASCGKKKNKRHPSLFSQSDSRFDPDLETEFIDFVLVYDTALKSTDKRDKLRRNYLKNLVTNGLKLSFRVRID